MNLLLSSKVPGRHFFPNPLEFITSAVGPLVLAPLVRNQGAHLPGGGREAAVRAVAGGGRDLRGMRNATTKNHNNANDNSICVCIHIYIYIHRCLCVYAYIYIYMFMHTYVYLYMYIYTHV